MEIRPGIKGKLLLFYIMLVTIFGCTTLIFILYINQVDTISENFVRWNELSSLTNDMMENLLSMEGNKNKYTLLEKEEYIDYYVAAKREYKRDLWGIIKLLKHDMLNEPSELNQSPWMKLNESYCHHFGCEEGQKAQGESSEVFWIPEGLTNDWIQIISEAKLWNQQQMQDVLERLSVKANMTRRWGLLGFGSSILLGLLGALFLTYSMHRPLGELRRGIRAISKGKLDEPIPIITKDEFGELAAAFNEMATRLNEEELMRSDFISVLSHEIRTPLTSIRESVNMIEEEVAGPINKKQRRLLEIASSETNRLTDLLNHLMQVSRMEAGAVEVNPRPTPPYELIVSCLQRMVPMARAKEVRIQAHVPPDSPLVMGDPDHLQQVLLNLLGNAIKFSPKQGSVVVRVQPDRKRKRLTFSVSDKGPGIPEEEQSMVFHKYYRSSEASNQVDGTGLGLSISKFIVEAHGGNIWVDSQVGNGSTFSFTLPVTS